MGGIGRSWLRFWCLKCFARIGPCQDRTGSSLPRLVLSWIRLGSMKCGLLLNCLIFFFPCLWNLFNRETLCIVIPWNCINLPYALQAGTPSPLFTQLTWKLGVIHYGMSSCIAEVTYGKSSEPIARKHHLPATTVLIVNFTLMIQKFQMKRWSCVRVSHRLVAIRAERIILSYVEVHVLKICSWCAIKLLC